MRLGRRSIAIGFSIALHAALLLVLLLAPVPSSTPPDLVEVEIDYREAAPADVPPAEPPAAPATPAPKRRPTRRAVVAARPALPPAESGHSDRPGESAGELGTGAAPAPLASDLPRALTLAPSTGLSAWAAGSDRGTLLRNEPGGYPDPDAVAAEGRAEAKRNVDGWLGGAVAAHRAETGVVDGYFSDMRQALEKKAEEGAAAMLSGNAAQDFMTAWFGGAHTYGRSGNPYAPGEIPEQDLAIDGDTPLRRMADQYPGSAADELRRKLEAQRSLRDFADGKFSAGLVAVVELRQDKLGALLASRLVQGSGNASYDTYVLGVAPEALTLLPPPPERGFGIHDDGMRSEWEFTGKIVYWHKLKDLSPARRALLMGTGLFVGGTRGDLGDPGGVEVIDPLHPRFQCKARLLRLY